MRIQAHAARAMIETAGNIDTVEQSRPTRRAELLTFLALALGVWPFMAVAVVGGYGFLVWMLQLLFGPPGPPAVIH
jgi:nitrate reductase NapE